MAIDFVHLHAHSHFSLLDGLSTPEEMAYFAHKYEQRAIAITDHGTMGGTLQLSEACKKYGIKSILGVEAYYVPSLIADTDDKKAERFHLILLAKNQTGLAKIQKVMRRAWTTGFYYKPRIEWDDLEDLAGDVVCLSGCMGSYLSQTLLAGEQDKAVQIATDFRKRFGDDYYIELQPWAHDNHGTLSNSLFDLAVSLDIPVVGTIDCHYPEKQDAGVEEILLAMNQMGGLTAAQSRNLKEMSKPARKVKNLTDKVNMLLPDRRLRFDEISPYIMTGQEVLEAFHNAGHTDPAIWENSCVIADKCSSEVVKHKGLLPKYSKSSDSNELLASMAYNGLKTRGKDTEEYRERLALELGTILELNFADYFLMIWDMIHWAKSQGIRTGPGRGSVGGCLLAYALGIIEVDPIQHGLLFARFLDAERLDPPDIDTDIEDKKRGLVKEYLRERWGNENVAGISTYAVFKPKGIVKGVGKVLGIDYDLLNGLTPLFETLDEFQKNKECGKLILDYPELIDIASKVQGRVKETGAHAAGMLISPRPLYEILPVETRVEESTGERIEVAAYDMNEAADLGLIKLDLLGLKALAIIEDCINIIEEKRGRDVESDSIGLDDRDVYSEFNSVSTIGIFQVEAASYSQLLQDITIDNFNDLAVSNALVRPGALVTQGKLYSDARSGRKAVEPVHPLVDDLLAETYGCVIYQEQLMQMAVKLAEFSWGEANKLRKIIGKKRDAAEFEPFKEKFVANAGDKIGIQKAERMWTDFEKASEYMFPKAHAVEYGMLSYQCAWLKHYYPTEFMWASLVNEDDQSRISTVLIEANKLGINIEPPDVNTSDAHSTLVDEKTIQFGLSNIAYCGDEAIAEIKKKRPFSSYDEFRAKCLKSKVKSNLIENMEKINTFRSMGYVSQYEAEKYYLPILSYSHYAEQDPRFSDLIEMIGEIDIKKPAFHVVRGMVKSTKRKPHYFRVDIEDSTGFVGVFCDKDVNIKARDYICALIGDNSLAGYCDATQLDDKDNEFVQLLEMMESKVLPDDMQEAISYGAGGLYAERTLGVVLKARAFTTKAGKLMATSYVYLPSDDKIEKVVAFANKYSSMVSLLQPMSKIIFIADELKDGGFCYNRGIPLEGYLEIKRSEEPTG